MRSPVDCKNLPENPVKNRFDMLEMIIEIEPVFDFLRTHLGGNVGIGFEQFGVNCIQRFLFIGKNVFLADVIDQAGMAHDV